AQQPALHLMPLPASAQSGAGSLEVDSSFSVAFVGHTEPRLERSGERFLLQLARQTGLALALKPAKTARATLVIQADHASKEIPKLHELGSDDLYYTQDEIRDLIAYARDRGIRVVPEFDMPGHSTAWFVGHPELASGKGPYEIERKWGVFDPAMDPTNEKVYKFLDDLIGEMARIFPDHYFHIGGDEVNGKEWDANPKIQ